MNFWPLITTFFLIGAAELGDKTQLLALGFAARFPAWEVIGSISAATAILMALAVVFGGAINHYVPAFYLQFLAGAVFIAFGIWTIFGKEKDEEEAEAKGYFSPFWIIFYSFFLAELGDKTQLATLTLSAEYGAPFQVWLGATLGMTGVNLLAVLAGGWIKKLVHEKVIKWIGAAAFIVFGLVTLWRLF